MLVNIDDEIMNLIEPVTVDKKELEDSLNLMIITGLEHSIYKGFNRIKLEDVEKLKRKYFFLGMLKILNGK
jgi:hypothetical protein